MNTHRDRALGSASPAAGWSGSCCAARVTRILWTKFRSRGNVRTAPTATPRLDLEATWILELPRPTPTYRDISGFRLKRRSARPETQTGHTPHGTGHSTPCARHGRSTITIHPSFGKRKDVGGALKHRTRGSKSRFLKLNLRTWLHLHEPTYLPHMRTLSA